MRRAQERQLEEDTWKGRHVEGETRGRGDTWRHVEGETRAPCCAPRCATDTTMCGHGAPTREAAIVRTVCLPVSVPVPVAVVSRHARQLIRGPGPSLMTHRLHVRGERERHYVGERPEAGRRGRCAIALGPQHGHPPHVAVATKSKSATHAISLCGQCESFASRRSSQVESEASPAGLSLRTLWLCHP